MSLLERIRAEEARRQRAQREDLDALSHSTGGLSVRADVRRSGLTVSPFVSRARAGLLPVKDLTRR